MKNNNSMDKNVEDFENKNELNNSNEINDKYKADKENRESNDKDIKIIDKKNMDVIQIKQNKIKKIAKI